MRIESCIEQDLVLLVLCAEISLINNIFSHKISSKLTALFPFSCVPIVQIMIRITVLFEQID